MAKRKRDKVEQLVGQLIKSELETQLSRLVRKAKRKALRETGKFNDMLRLEYHKEEGFTEAEIIDEPPEMEKVEELKKTEDGGQE